MARTDSTVWRGMGCGDEAHMFEGRERLWRVEEASSTQDFPWWVMLPAGSEIVLDDVRRSGDNC